MKAEWLKMQIVKLSQETLSKDGPMKIVELVDALRSKNHDGFSGHMYGVLTPSSVSGILRSYGSRSVPRVRFMKMRVGSHIWYSDGDDRIEKFTHLSAAKAVKRNPAQAIIDSIDDMLNWYKNPDSDW